MHFPIAIPVFLTVLISPSIIAHPVTPAIYPKDTNSIIGRTDLDLGPAIYPKDTNSIIGRADLEKAYARSTDKILPKAVDPDIYQASSNGINITPVEKKGVEAVSE